MPIFFSAYANIGVIFLICLVVIYYRNYNNYSKFELIEHFKLFQIFNHQQRWRPKYFHIKRLLEWILQSISLTIATLLILAVINTLIQTPISYQKYKTTSANRLPKNFNFQLNTTREKFLDLLEFQTISYNQTTQNTPEFIQLKSYILQNYQNSIFDHPNIEFKWFHNSALLIYLKPKVVPYQKILNPIGFIAHMDVVPVEADQWNYQPFSPRQNGLEDGFIYARGTQDDKIGILGLLESLKNYLELQKIYPGQFVNQRPIFFILSDDEEIAPTVSDPNLPTGEKFSADQIRDYINAHYKPLLKFDKFEFILDEGGAVIRSAVPGIPTTFPSAIVGICEKGAMNLKITVKSEGGHSSMSSLESNSINRMAQILQHMWFFGTLILIKI